MFKAFLISLISIFGAFFLLTLVPQKAEAWNYEAWFFSRDQTNVKYEVGYRLLGRTNLADDKKWQKGRTYVDLVSDSTCSYLDSRANRCNTSYHYGTDLNLDPTLRLQWGTGCVDPSVVLTYSGVDEKNRPIYYAGRIDITAPSRHQDGIDWFSSRGGGTVQFSDFYNENPCPERPAPRNTIKGFVFIDKNGDGDYDPADTCYKNRFNVLRNGSSDNYSATGCGGGNDPWFIWTTTRNNNTICLDIPNGYRMTNNRCRDTNGDATIRFGIAPDRGEISGTVFIDEQPNGKLDGNDTRRRNSLVRMDPSGANDTRQTDRDGNYRFGDLNPGSNHNIRLDGIEPCRLTVQGDNPKLNVDAPAGGNGGVNFRLTRRYFQISGNIYRYVAGACTPSINTNCQAYGRSVRVTAIGTGRNDDSRAGDAPDYKITRIEDQNGPYTLRLTGLRAGESVVGGNDKDVAVNCANARQDFYIQPAGATEFDISGTVYVDDNNDGVLQKSGADPDEIYDGGGTIQIRTGNNSASTGRTGDINNGTYNVANNPQNTNYTVRLLQGTLTSGFTVLNNDRPINMGTSDVSQVNFLVDAPANTYSIRGGVYLDDQNPEGRKTDAESYTAASGNERIRIQGLPAGANCPQDRSGYVRDINNFSGEFNAGGLQAGCYSVNFSGPNGRGNGWRVTYPSGVSPFTINPIVVGPNCNDDATDQDGIALCATDASGAINGNVNNVNFGIKQQNDDPWYQSIGGDVRIDTDDYRNIIPDGTNPICGNSTYPYVTSNSISGNLKSGILFTGNNPNISNTGTARSKASNQGWLITGNGFSPSKPGTIRTSYGYMNNVITKGRLTVNQMFGTSATRACTATGGPDCTFQANLLNGVYKSTSNVTIRGSGSPEEYTFPDGRDYVFLIEDDLRIESNIIVNPGSTVTFIVNGDIIVSPDVTEIDGIFSADGSFITEGFSTGINDDQLTIEGNVIANTGLNSGKTFDQRRDLGDTQNATCPAVTFISRPDFILNGPELLRYTNYVIQEIAPGSDRESQSAGGFLVADTYTPPFTPVPQASAVPSPVLKAGFDVVNGVVTINAEATQTNPGVAEKFSRSGHSWDFRDSSVSTLNYTGSGFMAALPNNGTNITSNHPTTAPEIRYNICFDNPGKYWVWVRGSAPDANSDLVTFGIDGVNQANANTFKLYIKDVDGTGDWQWRGKEGDGNFAFVNIPTSGLHSLNLYMRNDGARVDKLQLRRADGTPNDPSFAGKGDAGPDQSSRTNCVDSR